MPPRVAAGQAQRTRVLASRRDVRIIFPSDTGRVWGWPPRDDSTYIVAYSWGASVSGMDGPRSLVLQVTMRDRGARSFASLRAVVAAGYAGVCEPGMILACKPGIDASVDGDRVVLTLRDRRIIETLFSLRPPSMRVWRPGPAVNRFLFDSVPVEYVSPMIPEPSAALRAEAARRQRAYEASISNVSRFIQIRSDYGRSPAWLAVGDSVALRIGEMQCTFDLCVGSTLSVPDASWTVDDSTLAQVRVGPPATGIRVHIEGPGPVVRLVGRAPGRTTVRARIPTLPSDTLPSRTPPAHELAHEVVVTLPIRRVTIEPRPASVQVGQSIEFRLNVTDTSGNAVTGLSAELQIAGGLCPRASSGSGPFAVLFDKPGVWLLIGRFGAHSDTVEVTAVLTRQP